MYDSGIEDTPPEPPPQRPGRLTPESAEESVEDSPSPTSEATPELGIRYPVEDEIEPTAPSLENTEDAVEAPPTSRYPIEEEIEPAETQPVDSKAVAAQPSADDGEPHSSHPETRSFDASPAEAEGAEADAQAVETDATEAELIRPSDTNGWTPETRDLEYLGQRPEQLKWLADREALMGMTPEQYREFNSSMLDALQRDGVSASDVDRRAQGSAANYYSSDKKRFDLTEIENNPVAAARLRDWFGDDQNYPEHHMFDSRYKLGLSSEKSDYDLNISSDKMVEAARATWDAMSAPEKEEIVARAKSKWDETPSNARTAENAFDSGFFEYGGHGYLNKDVARLTFRHLNAWADSWSNRLGRDVSYAVFESSGPWDTSARGVSVHFRDTDWIMSSEDR